MTVIDYKVLFPPFRPSIQAREKGVNVESTDKEVVTDG